VYQQFHVFWFEHLIDQKALGMSMRVERASLGQVKYPSLSVDPSSCNGLESLVCHIRMLVISLVYHRKINMKICGLCKRSGQILSCYLPYCSVFNSCFCLQVQKRFESLKKRKDPGTFSEQGDTL
jgi:hypothetical protein